MQSHFKWIFSITLMLIPLSFFYVPGNIWMYPFEGRLNLMSIEQNLVLHRKMIFCKPYRFIIG